MDIKQFEDLLLIIKTETATMLLSDLYDEEKRTPQLYNSIIKFLDNNKSITQKFENNIEDDELVDELSNTLNNIPDFDNLYKLNIK
ncbi:hypothetical protein [Tatumella sp. JGM82]|uniref:hypothetical protein n=1 Tax=Tatumella sp. JGM82 TaxID=2799795 RepID=UPI001BAEED4C|nr:hypothetical protein [Tatumella sp. JGM82]MBS0878867.1 hypothetical protein [Tatumella sp. JGM82]